MTASGSRSATPALRVSAASRPARPASAQRLRRAHQRLRSVSSRKSDSLYAAWKKSAVGNTEISTTLQRATRGPRSACASLKSITMAPA